MTENQARELAAQCWCHETTKRTCMDMNLAEIVAQAIYRAWQQGCTDAIKIADDQWFMSAKTVIDEIKALRDGKRLEDM